MATTRCDRLALVIGTVLLLAYVVQARFGLAWPWLVDMQADDTYRFGSGVVLSLYLLWQWSARSPRAHKITGALAPLVLYIHASRFAYGYLVVLAAAYLGATAIGLFHRLAMNSGRRAFTCWFVVHVATVTMLLLLVAYHIVIAVAYE